MTLMQQFISEGEVRGEARGEARGRANAMKAVAKRMLEQGHIAHDIAKIVGLDVSAVEKIKASNAI